MSPLFLLQAVYPSGEGSATRVLLLQSFRSSTVYVHWCEVQADEVVWDGVYPSLPAFPDSNVYTLQLRGYAWRSGHLLVAGQCLYHISLAIQYRYAIIVSKGRKRFIHYLSGSRRKQKKTPFTIFVQRLGVLIKFSRGTKPLHLITFQASKLAFLRLFSFHHFCNSHV